MIITLEVSLDKEKIEKASQLYKIVKDLVNQAGREIIKIVFNEWDKEVAEGRDKKRFVNKGKRKSCVKTLFGEIEYRRNAYIDKISNTSGYTYLLDEEKEVKEVGLVATDVCEMVVSTVVENTYRKTAEIVSEISGLTISPQTAWSITQKAGTNLSKDVAQYAKLAKANQGKGNIETKILFEENDSIYLKLQGKSRKLHGPNKEMKVGIAYDGVIYQQAKGKKKRRILADKVAYATFNDAETYRRNKEAVIANTFNVDEINLRIINGDGAQWLQKNENTDCICVLDEFHRNKKLRECLDDDNSIKIIRDFIYDGNTEMALKVIQSLVDSFDDPKDKERAVSLYSYYKNNEEALTNPYERGIEIPPTRNPKELHHARLGGMESNVYSLVSFRMKRNRCLWSIRGANNLALILCAYRTMGLKNIFGKKIYTDLKINNNDIQNEGFSSAKVQKTSGYGYEYEHSVSTTSYPMLRIVSAFSSLAT